MAQAATRRIEGARVGPAAAAVDRVHLAQMTLGDRKLERELLRLFEQQAALLIARMRTSEPAAVATLAHTLKGSALGVGAINVAQVAAATEQACSEGSAECANTVERLALAVEETREAIAALLH
jgi:HPt (histidine-containing phosphotransfer) domain-containing protein